MRRSCWSLLLAGAAVALVGCASEVDDDDVEGVELGLSTYVPPPAYAAGKLHSDLTPEVVENLQALHAKSSGKVDAFIKVGDSITYSTSFLDCFASTSVAEEQPELEETRTFFSPSSWSRRSVASKVGWHTYEPLQGDPSKLATEIATMQPSFAVIMLGTNDLYEGVQTSYFKDLSRLVKAVTDLGIVPILSTIPPIRNATQNAVVPKLNLIVRKVAAEAKVPLMDFHATLVDLPRYGLSNDGIHPAAASSGACSFSSSALRAGYNQRNLLTLTALDRTRRAVFEGTPSSEGEPADGSPAPDHPLP